ncbi:MAG: hypothetical protein KDJ65_39685, partial [Anaerolineae bacterium]|nr:hypothetical protein [Anaerolineae bacterium]
MINIESTDNVQSVMKAIPEPTTGFPPEVWHSTRPSPRAARIKQRLLANERQIDVERARFATESYRATEGEPM